MVGKERTVVEVFLCPFGSGERCAQLLPLQPTVALGEGQPPQHAQVDRRWLPPRHRDLARSNHKLEGLARLIRTLGAAVDQHKVQRLIVARQHQQRLLGTLAKTPCNPLHQRDSHRLDLHQIEHNIAHIRIAADAPEPPDVESDIVAFQPQRLMRDFGGCIDSVAQSSKEADHCVGILKLAHMRGGQSKIVGVDLKIGNSVRDHGWLSLGANSTGFWTTHAQTARRLCGGAVGPLTFGFHQDCITEIVRRFNVALDSRSAVWMGR